MNKMKCNENTNIKTVRPQQISYILKNPFPLLKSKHFQKEMIPLPLKGCYLTAVVALVSWL